MCVQGIRKIDKHVHILMARKESEILRNTVTPRPLVRERTIPTDRPPLVDEYEFWRNKRRTENRVIVTTDNKNV
jgi:hypothetical protein